MEIKNIVKAYYDMKGEFLWSYGKISPFFKELMENKKIHGDKMPENAAFVFCRPLGLPNAGSQRMDRSRALRHVLTFTVITCPIHVETAGPLHARSRKAGRG